MRILSSLLFVLPVFADSTVVNGVLLNQAGANQLATWFGQGDQTFTNVLSIAGGTANGSRAFHNAVDGIGPTFILVQTNLGLVGGYNPASWATTNNYTITPADTERTAFIFNLSNSSLFRQRLGDFNGQYQSYNYFPYGPAFGGGHDLVLDISNLSTGYANGYSYGAGYLQPNLFGQIGITGFSVSRLEAYTSRAVCTGHRAGTGGGFLGRCRIGRTGVSEKSAQNGLTRRHAGEPPGAAGFLHRVPNARQSYRRP